MLNMAFRYEYYTKKWLRCTEKEYIEQDIEKLPCVLLVKYGSSNSTREDEGAPLSQYVYCPKHQTVEILSVFSGDYFVSDEGCEFTGLPGFGVLRQKYYGGDYQAYVPFRWRLFQKNPGSYIYIACDVLFIQTSEGGILRNWRNFSISADVIKRKLMITGEKKYLYGVEKWTEFSGIEIPDEVADVVMEAMRESTRLACGIKPSVLSKMKGYSKVMAYIERPFDLNIVYLKHFLQEFIKKDFDKIFPYEAKDNYRKICELLSIHPPKSLRKAYAYNPYAIVWYIIFTQWNVKDINLMQKFFYLDDCVTNLYLSKFCYNKAAQRAERRDTRKAIDHWNAVETYCKWLMEHRGEKHMLKWLYKASTDQLMNQNQIDTLFAFYRYRHQLSDDIKVKLLKDGLTEYIHDIISWEVTALSNHWENVRLIYDAKILSYECKINDYEFRLAHDTKTLHRIGAAMSNCVATYREQVLQHISIIFYVWHKTKPVACIEIKGENRIVQALGKYNGKLKGETLLACRFWAKLHKLSIGTKDLSLLPAEETEDLQDATVAPIEYQKATAEMNLEELLSLPEEEIESGYYLRLSEVLSKQYKHAVSAPSWLNLSDEKHSLLYALPQGRRLYDAVFDGNTEAMRALAFMYCSGHGLRQNYNKALSWLTKAAATEDEAASFEVTKLQGLIDKGITNRDYKILQAIYKLRQRMTAVP